MNYRMSDKVKFSVLVNTKDGSNHITSFDMDQYDPITDETIKRLEEIYIDMANKKGEDVTSCTVISFSRYEKWFSPESYIFP